MAKNPQTAKIIAVIISAAMALAIFFAAFWPTIAPYQHYANGKAAFKAGNYREAWFEFLFADTNEHVEGAAEWADEAWAMYQMDEAIAMVGGDAASDIRQIAQTPVGGTCGFAGIEWRVLAAANGRRLLIAENALGSVRYNAGNGATTWETSSIREFLNTKFIGAMSEADRGRVMNTALTTPNTVFGRDGYVPSGEIEIVDTGNDTFDERLNKRDEMPGGADTVDKVFLLSIGEAERYFAGDSDRIYGNINEDGQFQACSWWLRSPGGSAYKAMYVDGNGAFYTYGMPAAVCDGLRPALWIDIT